MKSLWRVRLLSLVAAAVIAGLAGSALAVKFSTRPPRLSNLAAWELPAAPALQQSAQPACKPTEPAHSAQSCPAQTAKLSISRDGLVTHSPLPEGLQVVVHTPRSQQLRKVELKGESPLVLLAGASTDEAGHNPTSFPAWLEGGQTIYLHFRPKA